MNHRNDCLTLTVNPWSKSKIARSQSQTTWKMEPSASNRLIFLFQVVCNIFNSKNTISILIFLSRNIFEMCPRRDINLPNHLFSCFLRCHKLRKNTIRIARFFNRNLAGNAPWTQLKSWNHKPGQCGTQVWRSRYTVILGDHIKKTSSWILRIINFRDFLSHLE